MWSCDSSRPGFLTFASSAVSYFFTATSSSRSPLLRVRAAVVVVASNSPGAGGDPPLWGGITPGVKLSRPPLEGEVIHTVSGVGLGVMPVRPYTPRRLVLTSSHWTNLNPSSSAMGAAIERRAVIPMVVADAGWGEISLRPTSAI